LKRELKAFETVYREANGTGISRAIISALRRPRTVLPGSVKAPVGSPPRGRCGVHYGGAAGRHRFGLSKEAEGETGNVLKHIVDGPFCSRAQPGSRISMRLGGSSDSSMPSECTTLRRFRTTRLVTRTKETNVCASVRAIKTRARSESDASTRCSEQGHCSTGQPPKG
jgi:hypothetical protein